MMHSFDTEIAKEYGILETVILHHFHFWISKNIANGNNEHDGNYWTYNSTAAFTKLFPYASEGQIRRALKKLQENGLIITGNYNQSSYDRTLWYALTEKAFSILQKESFHLSKMKNGNCENDEPIPDILPDNIPDTKTRKSKGTAKAVAPTLEELRTRFGRVSETINDWLAYKQERKEWYTPTGLKTLMTQVENRVKQHGEQAVIDVINLSMSNGWRGIIWDRVGTAQSKPDTYDQDRYAKDYSGISL